MPLTKLKKNPNAKPQVPSFTVMLIIIPVKLVDSNSTTQGKNNPTKWNGFILSQGQ
jgi:hypothetical protein